MHWLHRFPELDDIEDPSLRQEVAQQHVMHVPQGQVLFREGDACRGYVLLLSGSVRVFKMDSEGREILLYRVQAGQSCMLTTTCLLGLQQYPAEGITEHDVDIVLIPPQLFEQLLATSSAFRRFAMAHMGTRICEMMMLIEDVAFARMDQRVARVLLKRAQQTNDAILHCTHQELASEIGTAREVISRMLKNFERHDWIALKRGQIQLLEEEALQQLLNMD